MNCRICGNTKENHKLVVREMMYGLGEMLSYFQCATCGCLQIESAPDDMSKYYPKNYYSFDVGSKKPWLYRWLIKRRNYYAVFKSGLIGRLIYKIRPDAALHSLSSLKLHADSRILDVGCGLGLLLRSLREIGFRNTLGVDPFVGGDIRQNGITVLKGELTDMVGQWDVIMFHHSLEHIYDQHASLQAAYDLLNDNGVCLIRIPTVSSFAWRHYGVNWVQLDAPRHFYLHSIESLKKLANANGFAVEQIIYDSNELQFLGSELYVKNIPFFDIETQSSNLHSGVSKKEIAVYKSRAQSLNEENQGDQAAFYLRKRR